MASEIYEYRTKLSDLAARWKNGGLPGREELESTARSLFSWKEKAGIDGIWAASPPMMVTATIDDGIGQGLQVIHHFAAAIGLPTHYLGLLQSSQSIIDTCRTLQSEYLGLTVLQFDSEDAIKEIAAGLEGQTCILAGGPVFKLDTDFADRAGVGVVVGSAAEFIQFLLNREN